jgi:hypothetical protein
MVTITCSDRIERLDELDDCRETERVLCPRQTSRRSTRIHAASRQPARVTIRLVSITAAVVTLLAATGCGNGHPRSAGGLPTGAVAPVPIGGGSALCPEGFDYPAAKFTGRFYSPSYPAPLTVEKGISVCFATESQARAAGFRPAALPAGDVQFGAVILGPTPRLVRRACARAQANVHQPLMCPSVLPVQWEDGGDCPGSGCADFAGVDIDGMFPAAPGYRGVAPGEGHMNIWVLRVVRSRGSLGYPCAHPHSHTVFRGHPAMWYWCPAGSDEDSGHVVLVWRQQGMIYGVTTHGHTLFNMRLVTYIADHLVKVHGTSKTGSS